MRAAGSAWASRSVGSALLIIASTVVSWSEDITVTGYYPAPRAVYATLETVGLSDLANTPAARVDIGPPGYGWAPVKVNVNGTVQALDYVGLGALPPAPSGMVMIFQGGCPAGWAAVGGAWNGNIVRGGPGFGATGGSATHTHNFDHDHGLPAAVPGLSSIDDVHNHAGINLAHPHIFPGSTAGGDASQCCDQGCGFFESCDVMADDNHNHAFGAGTDAIDPFEASTDDSPGHQHTQTVTWTTPVEAHTTDVVDNMVSYIEVVFCAAP